MSKVLIYGDTSANIVDGSSIWLASITTVMSRVFDEVHVLLKFPPQSEVLLGPLRALEGVTLHPPVPEQPPGVAPPQAAIATQAQQIISEVGADAVLVRGLEACLAFSEHAELSKRLWSYVTDLPFPPRRLSANGRNRLNRLARKSRRMFSQTEAARSYLEAIAPVAAGKTLLMPPMVPDEAFRDSERHTESQTLQLVYAGKFAREWHTYEMLDLPRALRDLGMDAELTVVGDKYNRDANDPEWPTRMRDRLRREDADPDSGVRWLGNLPRTEAIALMARADVGIGWRSERLDSSLEISTKVLEYGAAGAAPLLNETLDHRELFTDAYPLFVRGRDTVRDVAEKILAAAPHLDRARALAMQVSQKHAMAKAAQRLRDDFEAGGVLVSGTSAATSLAWQGKGKREVLVASHDLKFFGEVLDAYEGESDLDVRLDAWRTLHHHNEQESQRLLSTADVVVCEWAGPNLVWYSRRVGPHQRLIARLHGFELRGGPWLRDIVFDNVDALIVVSEHYKNMAIAKLGVAPEKVHVVPNMLNTSDLTRAKRTGAQFRLGLVGWVPFLKRPDRAVDLLEALLEQDDRYTLHIRGRAPWEYPHYWNNALERQVYLELFQRLGSERLREHVVFEGFGADMASWLRKIGVILSPSDHESFHLAPAEGMASGAYPIVWERQGASDVFGPEYVHADTASAVDRVLGLRDEMMWREAAGLAADVAVARWDSQALQRQWIDLARGEPTLSNPQQFPSGDRTSHAIRQ
ncbi:glycosyltransferase [Ornithinimicrobium cavernae]|uniref:glycosyltransferase n=1 Tax=Ornithinimicrobium cavernae TaxID=2666047 RepID=UPI000D68787E|nr:glycosyltransferase [Ornithinimicrobium cavernae]